MAIMDERKSALFALLRRTVAALAEDPECACQSPFI